MAEGLDKEPLRKPLCRLQFESLSAHALAWLTVDAPHTDFYPPERGKLFIE